MSVIGLIQRAQAQSLFGMPVAEPRYASALGTATPDYPLGAPGAVREVKRALVALAQAGADPFTGGPKPITETTWKAITDDDTWDPAAATEFAFFVSRWASEYVGAKASYAYMKAGPYPSPPQPAIMGLELLAGVVNDRLKGVPALGMYEQWRGGVLKPPSFLVSAPSENTPVTPTQVYAPTSRAPEGATAQAVAGIQTWDDLLVLLFQHALKTQTEPERAEVASKIAQAYEGRKSAVTLAVASVPGIEDKPGACLSQGGRWDWGTGTCTMPAPPPAPPPEPGGTAGSLLPVVAVLGLCGVVAATVVWHGRRRA